MCVTVIMRATDITVRFPPPLPETMFERVFITDFRVRFSLHTYTRHKTYQRSMEKYPSRLSLVFDTR